MKSRLGERGQVTIPKSIRDRLGMRHGQLLEIREQRGEVVLTKSIEQDPIDTVYGLLNTGLSTDEMIEQMRGAPALPPEPSDSD